MANVNKIVSDCGKNSEEHNRRWCDWLGEKSTTLVWVVRDTLKICCLRRELLWKKNLAKRWCEGGENARQQEIKVKPKAIGRIVFGVTEQKVSMIENGE